MAKNVTMKEGCSYNIGVVIPQRFTGGIQPFYLNFYHNIAQVLEAYDYYGVLQVLSNQDEKELIMPRIYHENRVDGLIVLGQVSRAYVEALQGIDTPVVFLDFYGAYQITNYLISSGHRKIGFIGNIDATSSIQDRYLGYYKSLLEHKIVLNPKFIIKDRDDSGADIKLEFSDQMPTAFVCNCDRVAYNTIEKLKQMQYDVPGDISIVGFDNDIYATISTPQITTVEVNVHEMSTVAAEYIMEKVKDDDREYGRVSIKGEIFYMS